MTRRMMLVMLGLAAGLMAAAPARVLAHEGHGTVVGEVVAVTDDSVQVKTAKETVTVKLIATTKYEKDKKPVDKSLLKVGDRVAVGTSKAKTGELTATRIRLNLPVPAATAAKPATPKAKPATP